MAWNIKQMAQMSGISTDALRYYDKLGMVSPKRAENGYRYYDEHNLSALKHIVVMKYAHFKLSEIMNLEELQTREPTTQCNEICKRVLSEKVTELQQAVLNYQNIIKLLETVMSMAESMDTFHENKHQINDFIEQIFEDIQNTNKKGDSDK